METFNPDKIVYYLAACPDVYHDYTVISGEWEDGQYYIRISDYIYSEWATRVSQYLKNEFGLMNEDILALPIFSGFYYEDGWLYSDNGDFFEIGEIIFEVPVSDDAKILLLNTDTYEQFMVTTEELSDILLDGGALFYFYFKYEDSQITEMWQYQELEYEIIEGEEEGD